MYYIIHYKCALPSIYSYNQDVQTPNTADPIASERIHYLRPKSRHHMSTWSRGKLDKVGCSKYTITFTNYTTQSKCTYYNIILLIRMYTSGLGRWCMLGRSLIHECISEQVFKDYDIVTVHTCTHIYLHTI
jgi:hypothetical protein